MKDRQDLYNEHYKNYKTLVRHLSHGGAFGTPIKTGDLIPLIRDAPTVCKKKRKKEKKRCPNLSAPPPSSSLIKDSGFCLKIGLHLAMHQGVQYNIHPKAGLWSPHTCDPKKPCLF